MGQITIRVDELIKERESREGRRLALAEVARACGVPAETLAELMQNRAASISLSALASLCDYFQCSAGDVLYYDADPLAPGEDEVESRDIVARWERMYGADEHPPSQ